MRRLVFLLGLQKLVHSYVLYAAGITGSCADVYGKVSAPVIDTHEADIVRIVGLSGGAVFSSIWAK